MYTITLSNKFTSEIKVFSKITYYWFEEPFLSIITPTLNGGIELDLFDLSVWDYEVLPDEPEINKRISLERKQ